MSDLIDRRAVLDLTWEEPSYTDALNVLTEIRDKVKELPSVIPAEKPTYRKKAKRWKKKYLALKTEIEKMKAEIQNMPKTYPHTDHFDDYVKTNDVLVVIDRHIKNETVGNADKLDKHIGKEKE